MELSLAIQSLLDKQDISAVDMRIIMRTIMQGNATPAQIAGFLIALRCKGETVGEITAAAEVMRELAKPVNVSGDHLVDTCGTGGDGANTFNISTTVAFVVAAAGGQVAKHGNRSVSSCCGSADVLEAAGVNLTLTPEQVAECVREIGVGFLFAPRYHHAMQHTIGPRKEMGVRTLFNLLGPLSNPAGAPNQLIGVFDKQWVEPMAQVLKQLGSKHVLVVHADDGLDELSIATSSFVAELKDGQVDTYSVTPEQMGIPSSSLKTLAVDSVEASLSMMQSVLDNQSGPTLDIVLLNAGAAIYAANLVSSLQAGVESAKNLIEKGLAKAKFESLVEFSHRYKTLN